MEKAQNKKQTILTLLKVMLASFLVTALLLLGFSFLIYKVESLREQVSYGIIAVYLLANGVGGFLIGKSKGHGKLLWGAISGLCYFAILSLVSFAVTKSFYNDAGSALSALFTCLAGGIAGGLIS